MISIIIPTLNEEDALPGTLSDLLKQNNGNQIIVADGGSIDKTKEIAVKAQGVQFITCGTGRAVQMNTGAEIATGEWLLFLHADTSLPKNALKSIERLTVNQEIQAGCFHQHFSGEHWFLKYISWLHNFRCKQSSVMYGDQAIFIRRDLFKSIGGFPEVTILEDVKISHLIKEKTKPIILDDAVVTSSRKFEQRGVFKSFIDVVIIMFCYEFRLPIKRLSFFSEFR